MRKIGKDTLKKKAWRVFSKYIRNRDPFCVTCLMVGKKVPSQNAGHFFHGVLDFDPDNISGQCVYCNKWLSGNLAPYSIYLIKKLGIKKFKALDLRHTRALAGEYKTDQEYQNIIKKYSQ